MHMYQENLFQSRSEKNQHYPSFICRIIFEKYFIKAIEDFFSMFTVHSLILTLRELGEFSTVMQTLECVSGLHNYLEFSRVNSSLCLDEPM